MVTDPAAVSVRQEPPRGRRTKRCAAFGLVAALVPAMLSACAQSGTHLGPTISVDRTFYVSAGGDDRADGRAADRAWRSLDRVNSERLVPGDRVLLEGGTRFVGSLSLDARDAGDATNLVTVASYGAGRATIAPDPMGRSAISVHNTAGIRIQDLIVSGGDMASTSADGINLFNDRPGGGVLDRVEIVGVEVSGFANGIAIGAGAARAGFRRVEVRDSMLHDNRRAGLTAYGPPFDPAAPAYAHEDITVSAVDAFHNEGERGATTNTGSGIVLGSVRGGVVEDSTAHDNGAASTAQQGPIGIWVYDSTRIVMQRNVAFDNRTQFADGGGFGLDQNTSDSSLQYNLSYGNDGGGYLLFTNQPNGFHRGNVVRFNISSEDARNGANYGGFMVGGGFAGPATATVVRGDQIYQNTVVMTGHDGQFPPAVRVAGTLADVQLRNNIIVAAQGAPLVNTGDVTADGVQFQGNDYSGGDGRFDVQWRGSSFTSLQAWQSSTGQEILENRPMGLVIDPRLADPRPPTGVRSASQRGDATGFRLQPGSPVATAGIALATRFGTDTGGQDFFAQQVSTTQPPIGASTAASGPR
jgi:hypothetical protein